jgi:TolA-binding protein
MKGLLGAIILLQLALGGGLAAQAAPAGKAAEERFERDVDEVALASQEKAIQRIGTLLKKYKGMQQEPILLSKLAELQQQQGAIIFRIAHGVAHSRGKAVDLKRYTQVMRGSIQTLSTLIAKYPRHDEIAQAYYMRAKAHEEIGVKKHASDDYKHYVKNFPEHEMVPAAYMSLAEFAIEENDHPRAISHLKHVEARPDLPHFPFALYKLAWSHYNLKEIAKALSYAERQVAYYDSRNQGPSPDGEIVVNSDAALRETTLMDITTFHMDGYESGEERYRLTEALPYFRKLEKGPTLGRMIHRYAKLLRSHGHEQELIRWKDIVMKEERERPEALDVVLTTYDFQLNRRRYEQLVETAQDIVALYPLSGKLKEFPKAQKMLLDTAEGLQALIVKNKGAKEASGLSVVLAKIYDSFTQVVEESDVRVPRAHYNLAETLFTIKDYDGATRHYRWVVDHGKWTKASKKSMLEPDAPLATVPEASLKAIASRYEVLRAKNLIPMSLTAKGEKETSDRKLEPMLDEWVKWIDRHADYSQEDLDNFLFEANRVLYVQGHIQPATERLKKFAFKHPASSYAIPSASLVIDTYLAGKEWKRTYELAMDLMDVKEWRGGEFGKRLFSVAADSFYKQAEMLYNEKEYKEVLSSSDDFLKKYSASSRLGDMLSLAGNSAMHLEKKDKAITYFSRLITETPKSSNVTSALLARAHLAEDRYDFAAASGDYRSYLALPPAKLSKAKPEELENLRRKSLMLAWLSGDAGLMKLSLDSKVICGENIPTDCARFELRSRLGQALRKGQGQLGEREAAEAFAAARKASGEERTLLATLALEGLQHHAFRDRNLLVRWASSGWGSLDPIVKFTLLPSLTVSIPKAFAANRAAIKSVAPLKADEKWITRRVEVIREMENAATDVMKLPWARIRASVIGELASLYLDLSQGLATLPPPKGLETEQLAEYDSVIKKLIMPFEEKGQDMRGKAFEIASRSAVEDDTFTRIAEPFFKENPSQAKALKPVTDIASPAQVDLALLAKLDAGGGWRMPKPGALAKLDSEDPDDLLKAAWMLALQARNWQQMAFFLSEAQEKKLIPSGVMSVVKAVSLAQAGARGEALAELEAAKSELNPMAKNVVLTLLIHHSLRSCSRERTTALLKDVPADGLSRDQSIVVSHATSYTSKSAKP